MFGTRIALSLTAVTAATALTTVSTVVMAIPHLI